MISHALYVWYETDIHAGGMYIFPFHPVACHNNSCMSQQQLHVIETGKLQATSLQCESAGNGTSHHILAAEIIERFITILKIQILTFDFF